MKKNNQGLLKMTKAENGRVEVDSKADHVHLQNKH